MIHAGPIPPITALLLLISQVGLTKQNKTAALEEFSVLLTRIFTLQKQAIQAIVMEKEDVFIIFIKVFGSFLERSVAWQHKERLRRRLIAFYRARYITPPPPPPPPPFNRFPRRLQNKLSFSHKEFSALLVPSELTIRPWAIFRLP